jgi:hypothetical protein
MLASSIPPKFTIPFAAGAGSSFIRQIPVPSQITTQPGAASLTDGFPPTNFVPVPAGGIPPFGEDMNGILNQITKWNQWHAAGGAIRYDAAFAASIGGYPSGALVQSNSGHAIYESTADNNSADPNSGGSGWKIITCVWSAATVQATGSANIQIVTLTPAPTGLAQLTGIPLHINSQGTNTGATTLNVNGLGAVAVQLQGGLALGAGVLLTNSPFEVMYNGSVFVLLSRSNIFTEPGAGSAGGVVIDGTNSTTIGANLAFRGNGATTPNKWFRALNGLLQIINSAYTTVIFSLNDTGDIAVPGDTTVGGTLTAGGNTGLSGTLTVAGPATFNQDLSAVGSVHFPGPTVTINQRLDIGANQPGTQLVQFFANLGGVIASITRSGGGVAYNTTSDYRIKTTYGPAETGSVIDSVPVHDAEFTFSKGDRRPMFLAHEVAAVIPSVVHGKKDAVDKDGNPMLQQLDQVS